MMKSMARVCLNKLVIKCRCWLRNKVEQLACIRNVGDFKEVCDEDLGVI